MVRLFTRIQKSLGVDPSEITYELTEQAVSSHVVEAEDLDWKRDLPAKGSASSREFSKDIAAMANGGGGMIVYGIEEERGRGTAKAIHPVDISESTVRRLRALASAHVHPAILISHLFGVPSRDDAGQGVIVLVVARSIDAPHFIGTDDSLGIPVRDGSDTRWMREAEIARTYGRRFETRTKLREGMEADAIRGLHGLDRTFTTWLVAVAAPELNGGAQHEVTREDVSDCVATAKRKAESLSDGNYWMSNLGDLEGGYNARKGFRKRVVEAGDGNAEFTSSLRVELHDNGSIVVAQASATVQSDGKGQATVDELTLNAFCRDVVSLLSARPGAWHTGERYAVRVQIYPATALPGGLRITGPNISSSGFSRGDGVLEDSRALFEPIEVEFSIDLSEGDEELLLASTSISRDVLAQFGVESVRTFRASSEKVIDTAIL